MAGMIVMFVVGVFFLILGTYLITDDPEFLPGWSCSLAGMVFVSITTFGLAPTEIHTGSPALSIYAGEYQVAFVHIAGDNVSLGIQKEDDRFGDGLHLFLYQFPRNGFEGDIRGNATKLVVTESGEFKKLRLE